MAKTKRTPIQRERDLLEISNLYLRGTIQAQIAEQLGVSQQQVSYDLRILQRRWLAASVANIDERKAQELAKVDHLEIEYWQAWERSKENAEIEVTEQIGSRRKTKAKEGEPEEPDLTVIPERIKKYKRTEEQSGNPAFLKGVEWCIDKRCEILGLDAPKKTDLTSDGKPLQPITDERFDRAISTLANAIRESLPGSGDKPDGIVDTAE